ncbi:MAG: cytochrome c [Desulfuromonadaceae bacterium]|nr:cytochrome c [Desulfuromonadaceae bacterium]
MAHPSRILNCFITLLVLLTCCFPVWADQGKDLFVKQCAGCHNIGGGDSTGPDLKGVTSERSHAWLESLITDPGKLTASKDPAQAELVKKYGFEMPNLGISHEDALKIIAYLSSASGSDAAADSPPGEQPAVSVTPELIAQGKALFTGSKRFVKGGAPCLSCHSFTYPGIIGGKLSNADLSKAYHKMGDAGMRGALKTLKFPIMKNIYADRPLSDGEIAALMALFKDSATQKGGGSYPIPFTLMGGGLFIVLLLGLTLYKRRIR